MTPASSLCMQEDSRPLDYSFLQLLPSTPNDYVLILNDKDLFFSTNLSQIYDPRKLIAATNLPQPESEEIHGITVLYDVAQPWHSIMKTESFPVHWDKVKCLLWFADIEDDVTGHRHLLENLFELLAIRMLADFFIDLRLIITINNVKFAQLQVWSIYTF